MMEGWATDSKPAQFEIAAQELSAKYHSGIHSVGQSPAGQGTMSLQVLLAFYMVLKGLIYTRLLYSCQQPIHES